MHPARLPNGLANSSSGVMHPFGLGFAYPKTVYVADEGAGASTYSSSTGAGTPMWWAVTSTVSGSGDHGADPNQVVQITDNPGAQTGVG